jgi:hypothetical protein
MSGRVKGSRCGGVDPEKHHQGDDAEGVVRVREGEEERDAVEREGAKVFVLGGLVILLEGAAAAEASTNGKAKQEERKAVGHHGDDVKEDREGVDLLLEQIGGKEGEERECEEEGEVGEEDGQVDLLRAVDEIVMIDPIHPRKRKGQGIDAEDRQDGPESGEAVLVRDFKFEHHDGDDDSDHSVGEGFEPGWGTDEIRHRVYEVSVSRI